ncbi:MAG: DUF4258 domain-containing protein [bacterium]
MSTKLQTNKIYEVKCVLSKQIRTSEEYWNYISQVKHADLADRIQDVLEALSSADEVWKNDKAQNIFLYYKKINNYWICVVVKILNGDGFIVTAYITSKSKRKGKKIWTKK